MGLREGARGPRPAPAEEGGRRRTHALGTPEQVQRAWRSLCRPHLRWWRCTTAPVCLQGSLWQCLCHPAWWDRAVTVVTAEPPDAALGTRQPHPQGALGFLGASCILNTNGITALATAANVPQGIFNQKIKKSFPETKIPAASSWDFSSPRPNPALLYNNPRERAHGPATSSCRRISPDQLHTVRAMGTPLRYPPGLGQGSARAPSVEGAGLWAELGGLQLPSCVLVGLPQGAFLADTPGQHSEALVRRDKFISPGQVPALHILPQMGWEREGASWRQREREAFPSTGALAPQSGSARGGGSGAPHPPGSSSQWQHIPNPRHRSARSSCEHRWESPNAGTMAPREQAAPAAALLLHSAGDRPNPNRSDLCGSSPCLSPPEPAQVYGWVLSSRICELLHPGRFHPVIARKPQHRFCAETRSQTGLEPPAPAPCRRHCPRRHTGAHPRALAPCSDTGTGAGSASPEPQPHNTARSPKCRDKGGSGCGSGLKPTSCHQEPASRLPAAGELKAVPLP